MGYSTSSTSGYGFSLDEDEMEKLWAVYEKRDDAIDWILEERDEYELFTELFRDNAYLVGEVCSYMGEHLGALVLASETVSASYGFGVVERPQPGTYVTLGSVAELAEFGRSIGIYREPTWLMEVSYG